MPSLYEVFIWTGSPLQIGLSCLTLFVLLWAFNKLCFTRRRRRTAETELRASDPTKGHRWTLAEFICRPTYCSVCENSLIFGAYCDSCLICTHDRCASVANAQFACKALTLSPGRTSMRHHFVKGNLPLGSQCSRCGRSCGAEPRLCGMRCVWCQRKWHETCVRGDAGLEACDLGPFASMIVPPYAIALRTAEAAAAAATTTRQRRFLVDRVYPVATIEAWRPVLVLVNPTSGEKAGDYLMSIFRSLLNPVQVVNLNEVSPDDALEFCRLVDNFQCRVIVCGGDGTVGWMSAAIQRANLRVPPAVGIIPLGTGNDMARVLGWGPGYDFEDVNSLLKDFQDADVVEFDRWNVDIVEETQVVGQKELNRRLIMNNYFGIGCGAYATLGFHKQRESAPGKFQSRIFNKGWYVIYGALDVLLHTCKDLQEKLVIELDGIVLKNLPRLEGVVILNINSWSAGTKAWGDGNGLGPSRFDDGFLEVFGVYSSLHIALIGLSLLSPVRLGRARQIKIKLKSGVIPVQVNGEPWEQTPAHINISHCNQMAVLQRRGEF